MNDCEEGSFASEVSSYRNCNSPAYGTSLPPSAVLAFLIWIWTAAGGSIAILRASGVCHSVAPTFAASGGVRRISGTALVFIGRSKWTI